MEDPVVSAVSHDTSEVKFTLERVQDEPGVAAKIFRALSDEKLNIDMIVQNVSTDGLTDISFTVPADERIKAISVLEDEAFETGSMGYQSNENVGRISVIGAGMKSNPGIAATMFEVLASENINIQMISTSSIRISVVVAKEDVERGVIALHSAYDLDSP